MCSSATACVPLPAIVASCDSSPAAVVVVACAVATRIWPAAKHSVGVQTHAVLVVTSGGVCVLIRQARVRRGRDGQRRAGGPGRDHVGHIHRVPLGGNHHRPRRRRALLPRLARQHLHEGARPASSFRSARGVFALPYGVVQSVVRSEGAFTVCRPHMAGSCKRTSLPQCSTSQLCAKAFSPCGHPQVLGFPYLPWRARSMPLQCISMCAGVWCDVPSLTTPYLASTA